MGNLTAYILNSETYYPSEKQVKKKCKANYYIFEFYNRLGIFIVIPIIKLPSDSEPAISVKVLVYF